MQLPTCETKFAVENPGCGPKQPPPARNSSGAARGSGNAGAGRLRACLHSWSGSSPALRPLRSAAPGSAFPVPLAQRRPGGGRRAASGGRVSPPTPPAPAPGPLPSAQRLPGQMHRGEGGRQREEAGGRSFLLPAERGPGPNWLSKPRHKEFPPRRASRSTESGRKLPRASPRPSARPRPRGSPPARPDGACPPARGQPPPRPRAPAPFVLATGGPTPRQLVPVPGPCKDIPGAGPPPRRQARLPARPVHPRGAPRPPHCSRSAEARPLPGHGARAAAKLTSAARRGAARRLLSPSAAQLSGGIFE